MEQHWVPFLNRPPSRLTLLHGREIQKQKQWLKTLDHTGTVIDEEIFGDLPGYKEVEIPRSLSLTWIGQNAEIYTFLIDRKSQRPAGYINAMPVEDEIYAQLRNGKLNDNEIRAGDILPFDVSRKRVKVYMMSIVIAKTYRRLGDGALLQSYYKLMTGFIYKLVHYANNRGVRVTHFLATTWTPSGRTICELFGMKEIGKGKSGGEMWELDVESCRCNPPLRLTAGLRQLLQVYDQIPA